MGDWSRFGWPAKVTELHSLAHLGHRSATVSSRRSATTSDLACRSLRAYIWPQLEQVDNLRFRVRRQSRCTTPPPLREGDSVDESTETLPHLVSQF